jgi:hypothetical protein
VLIVVKKLVKKLQDANPVLVNFGRLRDAHPERI